jgi:hypothetical protein
MSDITVKAPAPGAEVSPEMLQAAVQASCDECLGSGGWFRYEPALDPAPGLLYLSCMQCRGSGRTVFAKA